MDATPQTYNDLMRDSIDLSMQLGNEVENVLSAMNDFARMGYNSDQLMDLTKFSTIMSNISELTPSESMDAIVAATQAYNIEASKSLEVVDKLNEVDKIIVPHISDDMMKIA